MINRACAARASDQVCCGGGTLSTAGDLRLRVSHALDSITDERGVVFRCTRNWTRGAAHHPPNQAAYYTKVYGFWCARAATQQTSWGMRSLLWRSFAELFGCSSCKRGWESEWMAHIVRLTLLGAWPGFFDVCSQPRCVFGGAKRTQAAKWAEREGWMKGRPRGREPRAQSAHDAVKGKRRAAAPERCSRFQTQGCHVWIKSCIQCKTAQWKFPRN